MKLAALLLVLSAAMALAQPDNSAATSLLPVFNPATENVSWNGKSWNITNHRAFESRFERYLSTPSDVNQDTTEHFKVLSTIRELLSPTKVSPKSQEEAFRLLDKASAYNADDMLSDTISSQVYSAWLAQKNTARIQTATETLANEKKQLEWNLRVLAEGDGLNHPTNSQAVNADAKAMEMQQISARLAEVNALLKISQIKKEISWTQARTEFQLLIAQLFLQRRFQHVVIATRFYRAIFSDGTSQQLKFGGDAHDLFHKLSGSAPTLTALESISGEMISNAHDGVNAFRTLLANDEMESATKRLQEAFAIGEYLTSLDVVSIQEKRKALLYLQKTHQLANALEVKDYVLAEKLLIYLQSVAKDLDATKAHAAIETAKSTSAIHLAKARNAATSGDNAAVEKELHAASEIWPTNPALAEVASGIYKEGNAHARAVAKFDQLVGQRSWREIYNERMQFIPALENQPAKLEKLQEIIDKVMMIDRTVTRARDFEKRGESAAAWETTEIVYRQFPEYPRLNATRAELAVKALDYVEAITNAEELEAESDRGSSLTWYLEAEKIYPAGELAKAGIQRLNHLILPDSW
jgi:predicted transcriptional regulator